MIQQKDKIVNKMLQLKAQRIKIQNQQNKIMKKISKLVKINQKQNNDQIYLNSSLQSQYIKYLINQEQQTSSNIIHNQQLEEDLTDIILLDCVTHTERMKDVEKQERQQIQANLNKENIERKQQHALIDQLEKIQKVQCFQNQRKNTEEQIVNGQRQEEIIKNYDYICQLLDEQHTFICKSIYFCFFFGLQTIIFKEDFYYATEQTNFTFKRNVNQRGFLKYQNRKQNINLNSLSMQKQSENFSETSEINLMWTNKIPKIQTLQTPQKQSNVENNPASQKTYQEKIKDQYTNFINSIRQVVKVDPKLKQIQKSLERSSGQFAIMLCQDNTENIKKIICRKMKNMIDNFELDKDLQKRCKIFLNFVAEEENEKLKIQQVRQEQQQYSQQDTRQCATCLFKCGRCCKLFGCFQKYPFFTMKYLRLRLFINFFLSVLGVVLAYLEYKASSDSDENDQDPNNTISSNQEKSYSPNKLIKIILIFSVLNFIEFIRGLLECIRLIIVNKRRQEKREAKLKKSIVVYQMQQISNHFQENNSGLGLIKSSKPNDLGAQ